MHICHNGHCYSLDLVFTLIITTANLAKLVIDCVLQQTAELIKGLPEWQQSLATAVNLSEL